jgi:methylthioribulose-1-phosphate dehydratase
MADTSLHYPNENPLTHPDFQSAAASLIEAGRHFYSRGWLPATSGNLSARFKENGIAITVSGAHKGELGTSDIMIVDGEGNSVTPGKRPSAETLLHMLIYSKFPNVQSVLHTHSPHATVLSQMVAPKLLLRDYELLKALAGITTHETTITLPIFANDQDIFRLAERSGSYIDNHPESVYGFLIEGHGLYTWGNGVPDARRHVEAFEFLFECEILKLGAGRK